MSTANQPSETVPKKLHTFRRIFKRVLPYRKLFYFSAFLAILLSLLGPCRPFLIMYTVDEFIFKNNFTGLLNMTMLLIGILLVESILRYFLIYATTTMGQLVVRDLRVSVFKHILSLRLKFFDRTPIGTLTTRTVNDVEAVNEIFSQGLIAIIADLLVLITVMAFMFYVDWRLTLISLAVFPLLIYSTYLFQKKVKGIFTEVRNQVSALNGFLQEHITGMNIIQIFSREKQEMKKFKAINKKLYKANFRTVWYYSIFFPVVEIFTACSIGLLVWWGSRGVINGKDIGVLIAFILYINMLFRPIRMIADRLGTLQMGIVASERIFKVLDTEEIIENNGKYMPENVEGKISFDKVWFAYDEDNYVLKDISFNVNAGESLAIVGATGAGKTSIINVLSRFYELNKGIIKIDDTDIRDFELNTLRSNIGVVLQDVFLFSGSVTSNISLNNKSIELEKIKEA
ncbi:MAG: ATP-binding cassette domain-containing protein, partial [Bacteroidetes bacterium]|nr:ATP-binding cassette domain-containing protein [Bacteroidota bacterium]